MKGWSKSAWTAALFVSLLVHGGAAALLAGRTDEVRVAGGDPVEIAILGNSFEDAVSAGEIAEDAEPVAVEAGPETADVADLVDPAEIVAAEPSPADVATDTSVAETAEAETGAVAEADAPVVEGSVFVPLAETARADETVAERADAADAPLQEAERAAPVPPVASPVAVEQAEPVERETPDLSMDEPVSFSDAERVAAVEPDWVEPEETFEEVVNAPIPMPRPDIEALKAEEERRAAERQQQAQRQQAARQQQASNRQPARQSAGAGGASQADTRRGDASGAATGRSAQASGQGAQASAAGNAAVSNYPGQVVSRLRRSVSYPAQARRQRISGEVHVAFTVARNGSVSGLQIVRSSGHSILDQAALQAVQRAAPFPPIPDGAGRSSWGFTVPLAFSR